MKANSAAMPERAGYINQIEAISSNPDIYMAGTIGRSAVLSETCGNPFIEYENRGQNPTRSYLDQPADIDIVNFSDCKLAEGPLIVDLRAFNNRLINFAKIDGRFVLEADSGEWQRELHDDVMQRVEGESALGVKVPTLPLETHLALVGIHGFKRKQDRITSRVLKDVINGKAVSEIDPKHLEPFEELKEHNSSKIITKVRWAYQKSVPQTTRSHLKPLSHQAFAFLTRTKAA